MTEAEHRDQHPEYDEYEDEEEEQPEGMTLADALKICECAELDYTGMNQKERDEAYKAFEMIYDAADKYLKGAKGK